MKKLMCAILATVSLQAFAGDTGGDRGHGGGSHFCPGRAFQESYDLYEGEKRYDLVYDLNQSLTEQEYLQIAINNIAKKNVTLAYKINEGLKNLKFRVKKNITLEKINDSNFLLTDKGCKYAQVANWDDLSGKVLIDEDMYNQFSNFHKSGLMLHEVVYALARKEFGHKTSERVRLFVASAFAKNPDQNWAQAFEKTTDIFLGQSDTNISEDGIIVSLGTINLHELSKYEVQVQVIVPEIEKVFQRGKADFQKWDNLRKDLDLDPTSKKILNEMRKMLPVLAQYGELDVDTMGKYNLKTSVMNRRYGLNMKVGVLPKISTLEANVTVTILKDGQIVEKVTETILIKKQYTYSNDRNDFKQDLMLDIKVENVVLN